MESDANPMSRAHAAPRCTATSKRTGQRCKGPAVRGWRVCRLHGARGGHRPGKDHPSYQHGMRSQEWVNMRKLIIELGRAERAIEDLIDPRALQIAHDGTRIRDLFLTKEVLYRLSYMGLQVGSGL